MKALKKQLDKAREVAGEFEFGTDEWESAMEIVRALVDKINSMTDFGEYKSIDGDIWAPK